MRLTEELSLTMQPNHVFLLQMGIEQDYLKLISGFLLLNRNSYGIYVSSNRSAQNLTQELQRYGNDLASMMQAGRLFIVDLVSRNVGEREINGAVYVSSPSELSAAQMAIEGVINKWNTEPKNTWLVIDSIPTLLIFNGAGALLHFLHFLVGRLRVLGYTGIIFTVEGSLSSRVFSTIAQLCDTVIKYEV